MMMLSVKDLFLLKTSLLRKYILFIFFILSLYSPKCVPNMARGEQRKCYFDLAAKPKYNCHHYVHDKKFDVV